MDAIRATNYIIFVFVFLIGVAVVFVFAFVIVFGGRFVDIPLSLGLWTQYVQLRGLMAKLTVQPVTDKGGEKNLGFRGGTSQRFPH